MKTLNREQFLVVWIGATSMFCGGLLTDEIHWWQLLITIPAWILLIAVLPNI